jgi:hypothetical protein
MFKNEIEEPKEVTVLGKIFTPDEAIDQFKEHIDQLSKGKERDKIRIILK